MFQDHHKTIKDQRTSHKLIRSVLRKSILNSHLDLMRIVLNYTILYKLNYYKIYTKLYILACGTGRIGAVKVFLEYPKMIYPASRMNLALKTAICTEHVDIVKLLLKNTQVKNKIKSCMLSDFYVNGDTFKYFVRKNKHLRNESLLILAMINNDTGLVKIILGPDSNIIQNANMGKETLMRVAVYHGNLDAVKGLLTNYKLHMNFTDCGFLHACVMGNYEVQNRY